MVDPISDQAPAGHDAHVPLAVMRYVPALHVAHPPVKPLHVAQLGANNATLPVTVMASEAGITAYHMFWKVDWAGDAVLMAPM